MVIGKLVTLANAFKSFTKLITGNKSSGSDSSGVAAVAGAADDAGTGLENASDSASNLASNTDKVGQAAQNAAKKMKALMGFDKINKLDAQSDSSSGSSSSPSTGTGGTGALGSAVDFGNLAEGDTVLDKTDKKMSALIKRCQELAKLFKKGFEIGFGNSQKKIDSINESVKSIGKNLKEVFTDSAVVNAANRCVNNIALAFGKITGSTARIGLTLADNLVGGVDKYLAKSKNYIKKRIVSMFDATGEIAKLSGDFSVALADIFDIFSSDDAKGITADIIQVFSDGFLGATDLAVKFERDFVSLFTVPIIQNTDKISGTLENMLSRWRTVFDALSQSVTDTFEKANEVYDQYFSPFVDAITQGISDIQGTFLDAYNTYLSPILDYLADKFSTVWSEHIQPALDGILELMGKLLENLGALWQNTLVPFIEWIINNIMPVLSPIIGTIGTLILDLLAVVGDVISGITTILGGFLDFCTGVFTIDFSMCWQGIEEILQGFKRIAASIFDFAKKNILQPFIDFVKGIFQTDWSKSFGTLGSVLKHVPWYRTAYLGKHKTRIQRDCGIYYWCFLWKLETGMERNQGNFRRQVFDSLIALAKAPLNAVIDLINGLMDKLNSGLAAIENAFSFSYDFKNPITGTRHYGHYGMSLPRVPTIPHLAQGAYVKPNTPQLAMIGDNLHQGEVVAPENKLREMAIEAVRAAGGSGVTREDLETIMNRAVMRIIAALSTVRDSTLMVKSWQKLRMQ